MIIALIGKGGVGKTTVASGLALSLSRTGKTALISSDFMPSLKHLFPSNPQSLDVLELSESEVATKWKDRYGEEVVMILENLFQVDDWVLDHIANSPGVAEEFMISNIVDLELSQKYEYVVWDTAASSSTMHLLLLQKEFYEHLSRDVKIYLKLRDVLHTDKVLDVLDQWRGLAQRVWTRMLKTEFLLVTTMDELSLVQSNEIERDLKTMGLGISGKICNRCGRSFSEDFLFEVPELKGSARDIVESVASLLSSDRGVIDLIKSNSELAKKLR